MFELKRFLYYWRKPLVSFKFGTPGPHFDAFTARFVVPRRLPGQPAQDSPLPVVSSGRSYRFLSQRQTNLMKRILASSWLVSSVEVSGPQPCQTPSSSGFSTQVHAIFLEIRMWTIALREVNCKPRLVDLPCPPTGENGLLIHLFSYGGLFAGFFFSLRLMAFETYHFFCARFKDPCNLPQKPIEFTHLPRLPRFQFV